MHRKRNFPRHALCDSSPSTRRNGLRRMGALAVSLAIVSLALPLILSLIGDPAPGGRSSAAQGDKRENRDDAQSSLPKKRVLWNDSRVVGSPDPPPPLRIERIYPALTFEHPLFIIKEPTSDRVLVMQQDGKVFELGLDQSIKHAELFFDVGREAYSLCFHPDYATNGFVYIFSNGRIDEKVQNRISRFTVGGEKRRPDADSEVVLLQYESNGHNGHHLLFGPDGMLYVSSGDGTGGMDPGLDGQDISNLLGTILRIDVDHPGKGKPYGIPADNPFVGVESARPEIWAFGFRNPFRMAFDPETHALWVADIGQDSWEMIHLVRRGENHGWSVMEGSHPLNLERPRGPGEFVPPIVEHPHSEMRSITGGYFYHGNHFPELRGAFLYGDYDTGTIWGVRYDYEAGRVSWQQELAETPIRVLSIGEDRAGEPLIVDYGAGELYTLGRTPENVDKHDFPRRLSETGLFDDVAAHRAKPGLISYDVNSPLWSDGAHKERFLALPGDSQIEYMNPLDPNDWRAWVLPRGTVMVKTFSLDMEAGNPKSRRRMETRLLTRQDGPQGGEWFGYTYRWNDDQTDAVLVEKPGVDVAYTIRDAAAPGGERDQVWHYPSRAECMTCHTRESRYVLGVNTLQMNREHDYGDVRVNQVTALAHWGVFSNPPSEPPEKLPRMPDPYDESQPLTSRVRSYLHANCAHCHVANGGGNSELVIDYLTPLDATKIIDVRPHHTGLDVEDARLIAPGDPGHSLIFERMARRGQGQMPPLATSIVDQEAVELFKLWIESLP